LIIEESENDLTKFQTGHTLLKHF